MAEYIRLTRPVIQPGTSDLVLIPEGTTFTVRLAEWLHFDVGIDFVTVGILDQYGRLTESPCDIDLADALTDC